MSLRSGPDILVLLRPSLYAQLFTPEADRALREAGRVVFHDEERDLTSAELAGRSVTPPPVETAMGALLHHITGAAVAETYQPMNVNFGLMPPIPGRTKKADRKKMYTSRARDAFEPWASALTAG